MSVLFVERFESFASEHLIELPKRVRPVGTLIESVGRAAKRSTTLQKISGG